MPWSENLSTFIFRDIIPCPPMVSRPLSGLLVFTFLAVAACNLTGEDLSRAQETPFPVAPETTATGKNVLIVYNDYTNESFDNDTNGNGILDGLEVAEFYADIRGVPAENILGLTFKWNSNQFYNILQSEMLRPETSRDEFGHEPPVNALRNHLAENDPEGRIRYIVLTKGVPLRVLERAGKVSMSVDMTLAVLFNEEIFEPETPNPYYYVDPDYTLEYRFLPHTYENSYTRLDYIVTRLDGYTVTEIKEMIQRSAAANTTGECAWVIDDHPERRLDGADTNYDRMEKAYHALTSKGYPVDPDPWEEGGAWIVTSSNPVIGYVSHGWWAGMPNRYITQVLDFELSPGAVFSSYESFNGSNFYTPEFQFQGKIAEWIRVGGSGGVANVAEPYTHSVVDESVFFPSYAEGYLLGDAAFMGLPYLGWMQVVVGDPLTCISENCT